MDELPTKFAEFFIPKVESIQSNFNNSQNDLDAVSFDKNVVRSFKPATTDIVKETLPNCGTIHCELHSLPY